MAEVISHQTRSVHSALVDLAAEVHTKKFEELDAKLDPWWCQERGKFYERLPDGTYAEKGLQSFTVSAKAAGATSAKDAQMLTGVERYLKHVEDDRRIDWAGRLPGIKAGLMTYGNGRKALILSDPKYVEPRKGDWSNIAKFIDVFMGDEQKPYFMGWHKRAVEDTYSGVWQPSQMLTLVGGAGCGKSLWQFIVLGEIWGTPCSPQNYFLNKTPFNGEFIDSVQLAMADIDSAGTWQQRRDFGNKIKHWVADPVKEFHRKGITAYTLPAIQRLTLSLNFTGPNVSVLPPLENGFQDKLMLFLCGPAADPTNFGLDSGDTTGMVDLLRSEVPAFVYHLLYEYEIEESVASSSRYGVQSYTNQEVASLIEDQTTDEELMDLIDYHLFNADDSPRCVERTSMQLHMDMSQDPNLGRAYTRIVPTATVLGRRLHKAQGPDARIRDTGRRPKNKTLWEFRAP